MLRVVIDSNVVVSSLISATTPPAQIMRRIRQKDIELIVTRSILLEYEQVLSRPKIAAQHRQTPSDIARLVRELAQYATVVQPSPLSAVIITDDPDDEKFIEAAVAGAADFIVSGDKHLLALGAHQGIQIVPPAAFVAYAATQQLT